MPTPDEPASAVALALRLVLTGDPGLLAIVRLSLAVSLAAVAAASVVGVPLGALLAVARFPGRGAAVTAVNALMGLPPVVAGLVVYLALSRAGPLGPLGLLFTLEAMAVAQAVLVLPIVTALSRQTVEDLWRDPFRDLCAVDGVPPARAALMVAGAARLSLATAILAGLGRALAEVGAIIIVGGNIEGVTRTMTTAIALETSKGDLPLALALGLVLLAITLSLNALVQIARSAAARNHR